MTFEPCRSGDCTGKLMIPRAAASGAAADGPSASERGYCPLCRQSYERPAGQRRWQPAGVEFA